MNTLSAAAASELERARTALLQGRIEDAARSAERLRNQFPAFPAGWHLGSAAAQRLGQVQVALELIDRAHELAPGDALIGLHKARLLETLGRSDEARRLAAQVEHSAPRGLAVLIELGNFHSLCGKYSKAAVLYRRVSALAPENVQNWFNLAAAERFLGNIPAAEAAYECGLSRAPMHTQGWYLLSGLRRQTPEHNHIARLEALLPSARAWSDQFHLAYALAKEYEDLGQHEPSFERLKYGADLRRRHMDYRVSDDVGAIDAIIRTYTADVLRALAPGQDSDAPIFVLGLPRTGTTLIERILGSHSQVFAAGELNHFAIALTQALQTLRPGARLAKREAIACSPQLDFAALGRAYLDATASVARDFPRFIDKMPQNYLYCGLIAAALPQARIIEVIRHPMDTCYAMYKQLFTMAYPFTYDLGDLAEYFIAYRRLMAHWHETMPGRILRVRYEDVVANQEHETRRMLDHCGLAWEEACLSFERNSQASTTASAVQVREKLYASSVGKWRRYERQLAALTQRLRDSAEGRAAFREYDE